MPGWAFAICSTASTLQILIWVMGNHDQTLQKIPAGRHPKTVLTKGGRLVVLQMSMLHNKPIK